MDSTDTLLDTATLEATVRLLAERLDRHRAELNRLNVYPVPDGDTGDNLVATLASVTARLPATGDRTGVLDAIGTGALLGGRGSSGVILGQALRGFVGDLPELCGAAGLAAALEGAATAAREAVSDPVEGTILTVADDAARQARAAASDAGTVAEVAQAAAAEGRRSLARTPDLLPALARAGVVDAGGLGYVLLLDALSEALSGVPSPPLELAAPVLKADEEAAAAEPGTGGRYEVLCLLGAPADRVGSLREHWLALGDTVALAGGDGTWRGHVHTDDVSGALAAAEQAGAVSEVEVTDLAEQAAEERGLRAADADGGVPSVVAVAEGDGLVAAYLEAGAQRVVVGGITTKPSTGELLRVVDACPGPVVLLAGDKDVVPAARHAVELAALPARLVPTDMLSGLLALEELGPQRDGDAAAEAAHLEQAVLEMRAVRVQRAVRSSRTELGPVRVGEWLAMGRSHPVAIGPTAEQALGRAAAALVTPASTTGVLALDQEAADGDDALTALRQAHPHLRWQVRRTNRPSCAYGLVVR